MRGPDGAPPVSVSRLIFASAAARPALVHTACTGHFFTFRTDADFPGKACWRTQYNTYRKKA
jgi:hypothetical protein